MQREQVLIRPASWVGALDTALARHQPRLCVVVILQLVVRACQWVKRARQGFYPKTPALNMSSLLMLFVLGFAPQMSFFTWVERTPRIMSLAFFVLQLHLFTKVCAPELVHGEVLPHPS